MRNSKSGPFLCTLLTVLLLTACQPIRPDQDMDGQAAQTTVAAEDRAEPAAPLTPLLTLQPPTAGEARSAEEIFAAVSPAVAFVETPLETGSAVLIEGSYLLTHANIVWPYAEVRVVFPDGSEHPAAPVAGWDLIADLALVGPLETQIEPLPLVDGSDLPIGSGVYLIGYPDEEETIPQPTIAAGFLSRRHRWETFDYTFFQVDAAAGGYKFRLPTFTTGILARLLGRETIDYTSLRTIAAVVDDQSGAVMVTHTGDVVGLSTFAFSGFRLAASIADALPRLNTVLGHDMGVTTERRGLPQGEGQHKFERTLDGYGGSHLYLLQAPVGSEIEISVEGVDLLQLSHQLLGVPNSVERLWGGEEKQAGLNFTVERSEFNIIKVRESSGNENSYLLTSSHPLLAYPDPDDRRILAVGDSYAGVLDRSLDSDVFELKLKAGDRVQIDVNSIGIDPMTLLTYGGDEFEYAAIDDDGGGGLFGENSRIVYEALQDDTYLLHVMDNRSENAAGYFVNVTVPTETALLTEPGLTQRTSRTPDGKLVHFETDSLGFLMWEQYEWVTLPGEVCERFLLCYFWDSAAILVAEIPLHELPPQERSRVGFVNSLDASILYEPGNKKLSAGTINAGRGVELDRLDYSLSDGGMHSTIVFHLDETQEAVFILLAFISPDSQHQIDSLIQLFGHYFYVKETE